MTAVGRLLGRGPCGAGGGGPTCRRASWRRRSAAAAEDSHHRTSKLFVTGRIAILVKGYPRLSETFIAQEIAGLEDRGLDTADRLAAPAGRGRVHPVHRRITADILYLPEYLKDDPARVARRPRLCRAPAGLSRRRARIFEADLARDPTANRHRRFGQACVLAARTAGRRRLAPHPLSAHAGLGRRAMPRRSAGSAGRSRRMPRTSGRRRPGSCTEKLGSAAFGRHLHGGSTSTYLRSLGPRARTRSSCVYHGLDLSGRSDAAGAAASRRRAARSASSRSAARSRRRASPT